MNTTEQKPNNAPNEPMIEMNMTPMIDVMLVLIIMFIMVLPNGENQVGMNLPRPCVGKCPEPSVVNIDVDFDDTVTWNGEPIDREQLISHLAAASNTKPQPALLLRPNRMAQYKTVASVIALSQRQGIHSLGLIGHEQFMPQ